MTERFHRLAVAICGAGHSGSTLLGLVLGSHSRCFYAGEAKKTSFFGDEDKPLSKRVCKLCGAACPLWSRFSVLPEPDLYEQLARLANRPVVVDSTKQVSWLRSREAELDRAGVPHKRLFLVRDGRAVINSRLRKYPEQDPASVIEHWIEQVRATEAFVAESPEDVMRVRYEELATEPERVVRAITRFLGLPFEPGMLRYEAHEHHPLGGNTGTQSVVARAAGVQASLASVPARSRDFYAPLSGGFVLDLRWERELPDDVRALFEARAGELNRPFLWEGGQP